MRGTVARIAPEWKDALTQYVENRNANSQKLLRALRVFA